MKRIVIVGATSGIGYHLANIYISKGWRVGVAGRREEILSNFKLQHPKQIEYQVIDVMQEDADQLLAQLINKLGGMDLYLHSSGIGYQNPILEKEIELRTTKTNVQGFTLLINHAYHYFKGQGRGHIATISSIAGTRGLGVAPAYSATKRYQSTYIDALEQLSYMSKTKILFTDILPGFVATDLLHGGKKFPLLMQPEYVANRIAKGLSSKKRRLTIDWKYKILVFFWKLIPKSLWKILPIKN